MEESWHDRRAGLQTGRGLGRRQPRGAAGSLQRELLKASCLGLRWWSNLLDFCCGCLDSQGAVMSSPRQQLQRHTSYNLEGMPSVSLAFPAVREAMQKVSNGKRANGKPRPAACGTSGPGVEVSLEARQAKVKSTSFRRDFVSGARQHAMPSLGPFPQSTPASMDFRIECRV